MQVVEINSQGATDTIQLKQGSSQHELMAALWHVIKA